MSLDALFQPYVLQGLTIPNRIVMAPMTRSMSPGGIPGADLAAYYRRRAEYGVGLIITEGVLIDRPWANSSPMVPKLHGEALAPWKKVVDEVHAAGGLVAPQLWHAGAQPDPKYSWEDPAAVDTPSAISLNSDIPVGKPLTESQIADIIASYARGARAAKSLGFDAIEIHAAHGYLIDQFFFAYTNKRHDAWGGPSIGDRARFGAEVVAAIRDAVGPSFPVITRISQWKVGHYGARNAETPGELAKWIEPLIVAGCDMIHCSQRRVCEPEFEGSSLNLAGWVKKITGVPTITVGSVGLSDVFLGPNGLAGANTPASVEDVAEGVARGEYDLVAVGRALLTDPAWTAKIRERRFEELLGYTLESRSLLH